MVGRLGGRQFDPRLLLAECGGGVPERDTAPGELPVALLADYRLRDDFINPLEIEILEIQKSPTTQKFICCNSPAAVEKHRIKINKIR